MYVGKRAAKLLLPLLAELYQQAPSAVSFKWHLLCKWHWHSRWDVGFCSGLLIPPRVSQEKSCCLCNRCCFGLPSCVLFGKQSLVLTSALSASFHVFRKPGDALIQLSCFHNHCQWTLLGCAAKDQGCVALFTNCLSLTVEWRSMGLCLKDWSFKGRDKGIVLPKTAVQWLRTDPLKDQKFVLSGA